MFDAPIVHAGRDRMKEQIIDIESLVKSLTRLAEGMPLDKWAIFRATETVESEWVKEQHQSGSVYRLPVNNGFLSYIHFWEESHSKDSSWVNYTLEHDAIRLSDLRRHLPKDELAVGPAAPNYDDAMQVIIHPTKHTRVVCDCDPKAEQVRMVRISGVTPIQAAAY